MKGGKGSRLESLRQKMLNVDSGYKVPEHQPVKTSRRASSPRQGRLTAWRCCQLLFKKAFLHCQKKNISSGALGNTLLIQTPGKHTRRSKRTDKMATWILEIIQLNKTIQANSNITTCLSLSLLPSSFPDLLKQRKLEQVRQELPSRQCRHKG